MCMTELPWLHTPPLVVGHTSASFLSFLFPPSLRAIEPISKAVCAFDVRVGVCVCVQQEKKSGEGGSKRAR